MQFFFLVCTSSNLWAKVNFFLFQDSTIPGPRPAPLEGDLLRPQPLPGEAQPGPDGGGAGGQDDDGRGRVLLARIVTKKILKKVGVFF